MTDQLDIPDPVRAAFAGGPGDEPPLGLTPDGLLGSGRRSLRRRRAAGTGLAAVAVAAVLTGAVTLAPGGTGGSPAASTPTPAAPTTAAPVGTASPGNPPKAPATAPPPGTGTALTSRLKAIVPRPAGAELSGGVQPGAAPLQFVRSQGGWKAGADYRDALGGGNLTVWLDPPSLDDTCDGVADCRRWVTVDGSRVVSGTRRYGPTVTYVVSVWRPDAHSVLVAASNSVAVGKSEPVAGRPTPPWTRDQLATIALDSGLR